MAASPLPYQVSKAESFQSGYTLQVVLDRYGLPDYQKKTGLQNTILQEKPQYGNATTTAISIPQQGQQYSEKRHQRKIVAATATVTHTGAQEAAQFT